MTQKESEELRQWRGRLKAAHLCRGCKQQDAYTLNGRTYCAECAARNAEKKRRWRQDEANRAREDAWHKALRDKRAENGLCVYCGKRRTEDGRRTCRLCISIQQRRRLEKQIEEGKNRPRGANGYCWLCNKRKVMDGKRSCEECYGLKLRCLASMNPKKQAEARQRIKEYERRASAK